MKAEKYFHVVAVDKKGKATPVCDRKGNPVVFFSAQAAIDEASVLYRATGIKHQPRPIIDNQIDWRARELKRFDKEYTPVPWAECRWVSKNKDCVDHFVHVSKDDPTRIAFTESADKGQRDVQTRMAPSKYLNRYYAETDVISERTMRKWLAVYKKLYGSDFELKFAYKGKDIVEIYKHCSSCMTGSPDVAAYEGPDLAVAYIQKKDKITARAVVWPDKKWYYSLYGDTDLLEEALREEGYRNHSLVGARLTYITGGGRGYGFLRPSIDSPYRDLQREGKYLRIV